MLIISGEKDPDASFFFYVHGRFSSRARPLFLQLSHNVWLFHKKWAVCRLRLIFFVFCQPFFTASFEAPEKWPSGRRRTPGKCVYHVEWYRGFESPFLRKELIFINITSKQNCNNKKK